MRDAKRLFLGVRISVGAANALAGCAETLARRARDAGVELKWVAPVDYHVTLKFLGWTGVDAIGAVRDAALAAVRGTPRFAFRTSRLGAFGSLDKATVLWAGVEDPTALAALAEKLSAAMAELGFAPEARPYQAHVTIARLRETRAIRDLVLPMAEQMFGESRIDAVTLLESETKPSGSVYRELARIPFQQAETQAISIEKRQTEPLDLGTATDTDDGWPRGHGPSD